MTNAIVRVQNGCFESKDKPGTFYVPGLAQITTSGGIDFFTKPTGVNGLNMLNFNPEDAKSLGNTITKIERTPDSSKIDVWKCTGNPDGNPVKVPTDIPNPPEETCISTQLSGGKDGCSVQGGHSCDIHITNGANNKAPIKLPLDYWQADFKTGALLDFNCKAYILGSSPYDPSYDLPGGQKGAFELHDSDIFLIQYGCGECGGTETLVLDKFNIIEALSLVPGGIDVKGCQTNPGFGYCNLLPVENNFFAA